MNIAEIESSLLDLVEPVMSLTHDDGSDTASVLQTLFIAMNTPDNERGTLPAYALKFPYVNSGYSRNAEH